MTKFPWLVAAEELLALRGHGGQTFADFVSALLRAEGAAVGVKADDIQTNTRVNLPDGGVDAEVKVPLGGPLDLTAPTCWQFKATPFTSVSVSSLREEANKSEAKRLIEAGYAYYACVCDDAPPDRMAALDSALFEIVREIKSTALVPRVLNVGHLADWAGRHPAIVLQFFRQHLHEALAYEPWLRKERAELPRFVELPARAEAADKIRGYVTGGKPPRPVLILGGPSGAGISRLVAETLASVAPRVIYVPDVTAAVGLVTSLVNQPTATGILVLDRCSINVRAAVEDLLKAETPRLRAIAIQDATEPSTDIAIALQKLDDLAVQKVIDANFEDVPSSHRRAFAELADGVLKIAVRLATAYVARRLQFLQDSAAWAIDELRRLVRDDKDLEALRALSLFWRVGYQGDVSSQLDKVCGIFSLTRKDVLLRFGRLSSTPGVAAVGPRYLSVRPRLFARPLFDAAWNDAIAGSAGSFLDGLSSDLQGSLLKQAALHGSDDIRNAIADWAMPWVRELVPGNLGIARVLERLLPLVNVCPTRIAPVLSELVVRATDEEARTPGEKFDHWPARQKIVWTLRQLLQGQETHGFAEAALFRLAQVEGNPEVVGHTSSTATEAWSTSFRLYLSGTELSFRKRLAILAAKVDKYGTGAFPLVIVALGYALDSHASKTEGSPIVYGDVRPTDWQPKTYGEVWESLDAAIHLLGRCIDPTHGALAIKTLVKHARGLLQSGRVAALRTVLDHTSLDEQQRVALLSVVEDFLDFDVNGDDAKEDRYPVEYAEAVDAWRTSLKRSDLSGRLSEALSSTSFRRQVDDNEGWAKELEALARELFQEQAELEKLLPTLVLGDHHGGALFEVGRTVGNQDVAGALIRRVFAQAPNAKHPLFLRGYVVGLAQQGEAHDSALKEEVDRLEESNPDLAVDLNGMNLRLGSAGARAIRLVRAGRLPPGQLTTVWSVRFQGELLADALDAILDSMVDQPEEAAAAALKILWPLAYDAKMTVPEDERTVSAIWRALETAIGGTRGEAHAWGRAVRRMSERHFDKAVRVASTAAVKGDLSVQEEADGELVAYIAKDPVLVLKTLGPLLLDPKESWRFEVGQRGAVVNAFSSELLIRWISDNGVEAAKVVAHHMPLPHADANGEVVVPPLTAFVLEKFEDDDEVFANFCSRGYVGRMYGGDIAGAHEKEAEAARKFRTHSLRRIREWADHEVLSKKSGAKRWREHAEEEFDE